MRFAARGLLWLHAACLFLTCSVLGVSYCVFTPTTIYDPDQHRTYLLVFWLAATSAVSGLGVMARRRAESESIALAASTIVAFLLAVVSW
jgi:hypothetical protein